MASFQDIFGNFVFLGIFILAGLALIIANQSTNGAVQPIVEDAIFNDSFESLESSLSSLEGSSEIQYDQFTAEAPKPGFVSIVLFGIVGAGKTFGNLTIAVFTVLIKLPLLVLGISATIFSVIVSWLVISLIVAAWILYKVGG